MKKRKILIVLLCLVLVFSLVLVLGGCTKNEPGDPLIPIDSVANEIDVNYYG